MIRATKVLYCANEHGVGNVSFPAVEGLTDLDFIQPWTAKRLRAEAKKAGWGRMCGEDYCEMCMASERDEE